MNHNLCFRFDIVEVLKLFGIFAIFRTYTKNIDIITNIISNLACWLFVLYRNKNDLISYYWYDTIISIIRGDIQLISHHIFTLYWLLQCPYENSEIIMQLTLLIKISDLMYHHIRIIDIAEINLYEIRLYQLIARCFTFIAWGYTRLYLPMLYLHLLRNTEVIFVISFTAGIFLMYIDMTSQIINNFVLVKKLRSYPISKTNFRYRSTINLSASNNYSTKH